MLIVGSILQWTGAAEAGAYCEGDTSGDDSLVFSERSGNLSEKLFRRRRFILPKTVRCRPEVEAGGVGLWG